MAFRYLIYSTGTTFADTIVRESATDNPGALEASLYSEFVIPEIQPVYLWRVTGGTTVVPNTDVNIYNYQQSIAPPPAPEDDASVGFVTGITATKIDKVTGATGNLGTFNVEGNLVDVGLTPAQLTGLTTYTFTGSGATQVFTVGNDITIYSTPPTGTTVAWGDITGTLSNQTDLWTTLTGMTGETATKLDVAVFNTYTGDTQTTITGIENNIIYLSGQTDTKLNITDFNTYSGATATRIGDIEDDVQVLYDESLINITGATNGLTKVGGKDVRLGGTLTQSTVITDSRGTPVGIEYGGDYSVSFTNNSLITKAYADAIVQGLDLKESVRFATTTGNTDIDLTGGTFGGTIDGTSVADGDRVLIKNQDSNKKQNGIYVYSSSGNTFGRAIDFVNPYVTSGAFTFVETGMVYAATGWVLVTQNPINVGTTPLHFTQFSEATEYQSGVGIDISGNVISVDGASLAGTSISWTGNTFNVDVTSGTLAAALNSKLDVSVFNTFTGTTLPANYYNKTEINSYTGTTDTRLTTIESDITYISGVTDTKLDISTFTGYTGATTPNEIFLTHSGGTELNTIAATAIPWDTVEISGSSFLWSGGTDIWIKETGSYELSYNIPYNAQGATSMAIGGNVILNNSTVIDLTAAAGYSTDTNAAGNLALSTVVLTFTLNDKLTLAGFRTGRSGSTTSSKTGSILIKKKNTLQ